MASARASAVTPTEPALAPALPDDGAKRVTLPALPDDDAEASPALGSVCEKHSLLEWMQLFQPGSGHLYAGRKHGQRAKYGSQLYAKALARGCSPDARLALNEVDFWLDECPAAEDYFARSRP